MTFEILLVALAALVLSNIVLLVAATRSGTLARDHQPERLPGEPSTPARRPPVQPIARAAPPIRPMTESSSPARGEEPVKAASPEAPPDPPDPRLTPAPAAPAAPRAARGSRSSGNPRPATGAKGGRGRRFTLPSIEVDHARTERVMLSLLTGDDEAPTGEMVDAWERMVGTETDGAAQRAAVVVALTLEGLDRLAEATGRDGAERLVSAILDAIRRSARASDRVASVGRGHFRVLLVDADDAVAARFVGRVRESADRRLAMASPPVGLAAGWAEAASAERLEGAVRAAEDRRRADAAQGQQRTGGGNPA